MDMSREIDQRGKESQHMKMSTDSEQKRFSYKEQIAAINTFLPLTKINHFSSY